MLEPEAGDHHDQTSTVAGAALVARGGRHWAMATLLSWDGANHTAMGYSPCIADAAARYLIDLTVPADGTHCPP